MTDNKLPLGENISDEQIKHSFNMVKDIPFDNESLTYQLLISKSWNPTSIHLQEQPVINPEKMTGIGLFVGNQVQNSRAFISLQVMELPQEINAADVLRGYVLANDYKLITLQEDSPKRVDSLVEFQMQGGDYLGRALMAITGNRVGFLLAVGAPSEYEQLKDIFSLAIASFEMPHAPQGHIETWREYQMGVNWLHFYCPTTWTFDYPDSSDLTDRFGLELYNTHANDEVIGIIRAKTVLKKDTTAIGDELEKFMDELQEMGVEFGEIMNRQDLPVNSPFIAAHQVIYQILDKQVGIVREAWVALLEDDQYLSFFALLTCRREEAFSVWAVNKRAWQIMLNTLRQGEAQ
jgi:hypothetical protein